MMTSFVHHFQDLQGAAKTDATVLESRRDYFFDERRQQSSSPRLPYAGGSNADLWVQILLSAASAHHDWYRLSTGAFDGCAESGVNAGR